MVHGFSGRFFLSAMILATLLISAPFALALQTSTSTKPSRFSRTAEREILFQEGLLHYSRGELGPAATNFREVLKDDPTDAEAHYYLGLSELDSGNPGDAVVSFNQSLKLDPTADEVRAARATANIRIAKYDAAREDLSVLERDPRWTSLVSYLRGQLAYAEGDLEGASREFAAARAAGGKEMEPAGFYEGLTYLRMRQLVRARSLFRETGLGADRDPTLAAASRQLDAVLAGQQRRAKPWEVQLSLGYEYDTNVILLGSNIENPADISDEADGRFVVQPRGSYSLIRTPRIDAGLEGTAYLTWQNELSDFDTSSYQAGPFINYKLAENWYASARYGFNYIELGHDPFLKRHIVTPQLTWVQPKFGYTSGYYQFQQQQFDGDPGSEAFDRDGQVHTLGIVQGINLRPLFRDSAAATLELSYRYENQNTKGTDFDGDFHTVGATLYSPLPLWKLRADLGVTLGYEGYDNPNSLDADGEERNDWEFTVSAGLTKQLFEEKGVTGAVRIDYTYTDHNSNVETAIGQQPYEYDRHLFGVRLIFSY